jgi:hypothetical protein
MNDCVEALLLFGGKRFLLFKQVLDDAPLKFPLKVGDLVELYGDRHPIRISGR